MIAGYVIADVNTKKLYAEDHMSGGYMYWTDRLAAARMFNTSAEAQERVDFWWGRPGNASYVRDTTATILPVTVNGL